ncbi:hypothetical protein [Pseudomonas sp. S3_H04]
MNKFGVSVFPFLALLMVAVVLYPYHQQFGFLSGDRSDWGAFGDFFGGVLNPIFALFAFFAVLHSLRIQMKQIDQLSIDKKVKRYSLSLRTLMQDLIV